MSNKIKLVPPDEKQCQAIILSGCWPDAQHFMTIGPKQRTRCTQKPIVIAHENRAADDGLKGSMSLCADHLREFNEKMPKGFATIVPIKSSSGARTMREARLMRMPTVKRKTPPLRDRNGGET
jgi:hypothetical protein